MTDEVPVDEHDGGWKKTTAALAEQEPRALASSVQTEQRSRGVGSRRKSEICILNQWKRKIVKWKRFYR